MRQSRLPGRVIDDDDTPAASTTEPPSLGDRLLGLALAWREAIEIADAHRTRLRSAVLADIAAGLSVTEASRLTGLSRVTLHEWMREANGPPPR